MERGERERGRDEEMKGWSRRYEVVLMRWACSRATRENLLKEGEREREVGATALHSMVPSLVVTGPFPPLVSRPQFLVRGWWT